MSYFLSSQNLRSGDTAEITGEEALHILLSRRIKKGELIKLQGPDAGRFVAEVVHAGKKSLTVKVLNQLPVPGELPFTLTLYQALVAEKALDLILQKSTELGASDVILFNSQNSPAKLSQEQLSKKMPRWEAILWEAAKQCDRAKVPTLRILSAIDEVLKSAATHDHLLVLDASGAGLRVEDGGYKSVGLVVGPEGGLAKQEFEQLQSLPNASTVKLSPFTLRSETAAIAGLAVLGN